MTLTVSDVFIAVILFSCVPIQYFIVQNWGSSESNRSYTIKRLITQLTNFQNKYFTLDSWGHWLFQLLNLENDVNFYGPDFYDGESPAIEVMKYKENKGFFGTSTDPRAQRSPYVEFHIGQIVMHKVLKYRGVIIGWDENAKAPLDWIAELDEKNKKLKNMPNYAILVDTRDRLIPQLTYVPQENIKISKSTAIFHPLVENYFEHFDGAQYVPRPWLRALYPQD